LVLPAGDFFGVLVNTVSSLALVLGLLFLLRYYLLRGVGGSVPRRAAQLRVREQLMLGPRARVVLLDVAERTYLVGMSEQAVTMVELKDLAAPSGEALPPTSSTFATHLQDMLTKLRQGGKR